MGDGRGDSGEMPSPGLERDRAATKGGRGRKELDLHGELCRNRCGSSSLSCSTSSKFYASPTLYVCVPSLSQHSSDAACSPCLCTPLPNATKKTQAATRAGLAAGGAGSGFLEACVAASRRAGWEEAASWLGNPSLPEVDARALISSSRLLLSSVAKAASWYHSLPSLPKRDRHVLSRYFHLRSTLSNDVADVDSFHVGAFCSSSSSSSSQSLSLHLTLSPLSVCLAVRLTDCLRWHSHSGPLSPSILYLCAGSTTLWLSSHPSWSTISTFSFASCLLPLGALATATSLGCTKPSTLALLSTASAWGGYTLVKDAKKAGLPLLRAAGGAAGIAMVAAGGAALPVA